MNFLKNAWIVWAAASLFYAYEFILRVAPAAMSSDIMKELEINAFTMGSLSAMYFISYAVLQIPVGIIADRFGPKVPMILACAACAGGSFFFAQSESITTLKIARFIIGAGSAFAFVSTLQLVHSWFPKNHFATVICWTNLLAMLGAVFAQAPIASLVRDYGWREVQTFISYVGVGTVVILMLFSYNKPADKEHVVQSSFNLGNLVQAVKKPMFFFMALYVAFMHMALPGFGALWGISFIRAEYHIAIPKAAAIASLVYVGAAVGSIVVGRIADKLGNRSLVMLGCSLIGAVMSALLIYVPMPQMYSRIVIFLLGFSTAGYAVGYALARDLCPDELYGSVAGYMNTILVAFAALVIPLISYLLVFNQAADMVYPFKDFQIAMTPLFIGFVIATIISGVFYRKRMG